MLARNILKVSAVILFYGISTARATPPLSASVSGVKNVGWKPGVCLVASMGQLIQQKEPNITAAEVVVRSGICTQTAYIQGVLVDHPRFLDMGEPTDVARLFGTGYSVGYKGRAPGITKGADSITKFKTIDEVIGKLKEIIASGTPVQVHVDTAYLSRYGGIHGSHYVVVYGYDENNIYYCENGGPDGSDENLPLGWDDFKAAWFDCYMLWLNNGPIRLNNDWIVVWLARDIAATNKRGRPTGPDAIRAAVAAIRKKGNGDKVFNTWMQGLYGNWRPFMVEFLNNAGHTEMAGRFGQACEKWNIIFNTPLSNPDWGTFCDLMEQAADIEEEVEGEMSVLADSLKPVCLFTPTDFENLSTLENCKFRWAQMPDVSKVSMQLAMAGDFADKLTTGVFKPKKNNWFISMAKNDWLKVLKKDDNDQSLSWRIGGVGKEAGTVSAVRTLDWDVQQMVSVAPAPDTVCSESVPVTFTFEQPYVAMNPCVAISTTGDFNDRLSRIILKPKRNQTQVSFKSNTLALLKKKDDGDKVAYWRVEDASTKITTVEPSEAQTLILP